MSTFVFPESIKSRPTYGKLQNKFGKAYLFIADAEGAEAIIELASKDPALMQKHMLFIYQKILGISFLKI